jgi:capsular exopolysaccharide synthesis family protein
MSRIDEALKRASQGPLAPRSHRAAEAPLRLADEFTLNDYPVENRTHPTPVERLDLPMNPSPVPVLTPVRSEPRPTAPSVDFQPNDKLVVGPAPNHVSMEQYRRLAATLHDAQVEKGLKSVMVTSAVPREGKTLTATNLALTLSESYGRRVLLIDADLRRPSVHQVLGIQNDVGLSDVLRSTRLESALVQLTARLTVLPSGRPDQNPLEGLTSERMRALLEDVSSRFDWVVIDTPPIGLLSDAQVLSRLAQAAIFVIKAGSTPFETVDRSIAELGRDCIIGTVLNGVEHEAIPSTYYGDYYRSE